MNSAFRLFALVLACLVAPSAYATCTLSVEATVPLTISGPRLYVPVSINETPGLFLVDTGMATTLLTADYAARAHVGMDVHAGRSVLTGVGNRQTLPVNQAHARHIEIGKISFQDWEFLVVPPEAGGLGKTEHDGILGMDFMHYFDIDVDLDARTLTFWRLHGCTDIHPEWKGDYDAIPLKHIANPGVTMPIFVDNAFLDVQFDTGATGLLLTRAAAAKAGVTDSMLANDADPHGRGIGGKFPSVIHRFQLLLVGNGEFHNANIDVETENHRTSYADGLIDWRYLKAKKFWISYTTNTLFVQSAKP